MFAPLFQLWRSWKRGAKKWVKALVHRVDTTFANHFGWFWEIDLSGIIHRYFCLDIVQVSIDYFPQHFETRTISILWFSAWTVWTLVWTVWTLVWTVWTPVWTVWTPVPGVHSVHTGVHTVHKQVSTLSTQVSTLSTLKCPHCPHKCPHCLHYPHWKP